MANKKFRASHNKGGLSKHGMIKYTYVDQYRNETNQPEIVERVIRVKPLSRVYNSHLEGPAGIGRNTQIGPDVKAGKYFSMGEDCYCARATIGRYTAFGSRTSINPFSHPTNWLSIHEFQYHPNPDAYDWFEEWQKVKKLPRATLFKYVNMGNDVWTGLNVTVLGGVTVGDGAILATGSVVTKDVAPYAIVAGAPARFIRFRFPEETVVRLQAVRWWDLPLPLLSGLPFDQIDRCLDTLEEIRAHYDREEPAN
jgi:acetyltransferase-like isoleucine patch superfamily enzyme